VIGAFAVVVGLLVLLSLMSRVRRLAAASAATMGQARGRLDLAGPAPSTPAAPALGPREAVLPTFGQRSADRTTLAAGAMLGLGAALVVTTARRGVRAALSAVRGR
jgi:membrane protein